MPNEMMVPEWYFAASKQCIIPGEGYNNGKGGNDNMTNTIGCITKSNGKLITLSFHIEAADEIKCYLFYEGQASRFYGQDILQVFPTLFDMEYKNNKEFIQSNNYINQKKLLKILSLKMYILKRFIGSFGNDNNFQNM